MPPRTPLEQRARFWRAPVQRKQARQYRTVGDHREKRPDEQVDIEAAELLPVYQLLEV
jgi:hypothetical protein